MATVTGAKQNPRAIIWKIVGTKFNVPELTMLINPGNLDHTYAQLITETRTLGGFTQEFWGEQLSTLAAAGRTAMFYGDSGLSNTDERISTAYENFIRLVNIYKNNGKIYSDTVPIAFKGNQNRIAELGTVIMTYMQKDYEGFFENFTIRKSGDKPFYLEYDFGFKVTRIVGDYILQGGNYLR